MEGGGGGFFYLADHWVVWDYDSFCVSKAFLWSYEKKENMVTFFLFLEQNSQGERFKNFSTKFSNFSLNTFSAIRDRKWRVRSALRFFTGWSKVGGTEFCTGIILSIKILEEEDSLMDFVFFDGSRFSGAFFGWFFAFFAAGGLLVDDDGLFVAFFFWDALLFLLLFFFGRPSPLASLRRMKK